ncbi:DUF3987 domain-containing protein [Phocaeicola sp.]
MINLNNPLEDLQRLTAAVTAAHADIAPTYLEYMQMAFAIATDCGEAGRASFHDLCRQSSKYDEAAAEKLFSSALRNSNNTSHLGTVFHLAKACGVTVFPPRDDRPTGEGEAHPSPSHTHTHAREEKENDLPHPNHPPLQQPDESAMPPYAEADGNGGGDLVPGSEPYSPLPVFPQDYKWPAFLQRIINYGVSAPQRDVYLLSAVNVLGASLSQNLRCLYGHKWQAPTMQTFIVAPSASGKGVLPFVRKLVEPIHDERRNTYKEQMKQYIKDKSAYDALGKQRATANPPERPLNKLFLIPANNSGTGILQNIIDSGGTGLICESEADTVSASIGADYGQWSHVLRKLFDQDSLAYNRRTEQEYMEVRQTSVSVLLSGTPAQVKPLIPSAENGLFSRDIFYYMPTIRKWANQFFEDGLDMDEEFRLLGLKWKKELDEIKKMGMFSLTLTQAQMDRFNEVYSALFQRSQLTNGHDMTSSVVREAINTCRILSVVALLRSREDPSLVKPGEGITADNMKDGIITRWELSVTDADFQAVLALVEPLYCHSTHILSFLATNEVKTRSTADKDLLFAYMDDIFSRMQLVEKGKEMNIPENTMYHWLKQLVKSGAIAHGEEKGIYLKVKKK